MSCFCGNSCGNDATVDVSGPLLALRNGHATGVDQSCKAVSNSTVIVRNSCPFNGQNTGSLCNVESAQCRVSPGPRFLQSKACESAFQTVG